MIDLKCLSPAQLRGYVLSLGWKPYRAGQILAWIYQKRVTHIEAMSNLSRKSREELQNQAFLSHLRLNRLLTSQDGTRKYQFLLADGGLIESVLIPEEDHLTLCLSTQLGCALKCRFCYSGREGLIRNLSSAEIVNQLEGVLNHLGEENRVKNLVLMGMGEPLANYENTLKALEVIMDPMGFDFSHRRVTLSSAGLVPELRRLGQESPVSLAISLNAADDSTRSFLMPVNQRYPLRDLIKACREYPLDPRKKITMEYILIAGVNDSLRDAQKLADLLRPIRCKINLIPFNEHPGVDFRRPVDHQIQAFRNFLVTHGYTAILRQSRGADILAACGQLSGKPATPPDTKEIEPSWRKRANLPN